MLTVQLVQACLVSFFFSIARKMVKTVFEADLVLKVWTFEFHNAKKIRVEVKKLKAIKIVKSKKNNCH